MSKQTILVVDDDPEIVRLLRGYLHQAGFGVLVAHDGETAMHTIRAEKPDLLILDLMLPDRDGWDITRALRVDAVHVALPILMLTARVEDLDKILGLELGAHDYVTKPFNPREVVARAASVCQRRYRAPDTGGAESAGKRPAPHVAWWRHNAWCVQVG